MLAVVPAVPEPDVFDPSVMLLFLQASIITGVEMAPIIKLLMKFFLSIVNAFCFVGLKLHEIGLIVTNVSTNARVGTVNGINDEVRGDEQGAVSISIECRCDKIESGVQ